MPHRPLRVDRRVCMQTAAAVSVAMLTGDSLAAADAKKDLFARDNLVAWCIVPFDAKRRGPDERVEVLRELGLKKYAYDWRSEHLPTFDHELDLLAKHAIELTSVWFPAGLGDEAKTILALLEKHKLKTQLWVSTGGADGADDAAKANATADQLRPVVDAAAKLECRVSLYNHGGWFGEPENQLLVLERLAAPHVGIVYNQHHGHGHLDRFPTLLKQVLPHLHCLNLNGMDDRGDQVGRKILALGEGKRDLEMLRVVRDSGYAGPIGILGHTSDDMRLRLMDNLDGLDWLRPQLDGQPAGPRPAYRTTKVD